MIDDLVRFDSIMEHLAPKATDEMILERHMSQLQSKWDAIEAVHQSIVIDVAIKKEDVDLQQQIYCEAYECYTACVTRISEQTRAISHTFAPNRAIVIFRSQP